MGYLVEENYVTICHCEDYGPGCLGFQTNEENLLVQSIILNQGGMILASAAHRGYRSTNASFFSKLAVSQIPSRQRQSETGLSHLNDKVTNAKRGEWYRATWQCPEGPLPRAKKHHFGYELLKNKNWVFLLSVSSEPRIQGYPVMCY